MNTPTNDKQPSHSPSTIASVKRTDLVYREICAKLVPKLETPDFSRQFLPLGDLESILSEEVVTEILAQSFSPDNIQGVSLSPVWGRRDAMRRIQILGTLILIGKVKYIDYFCQNNLFDEALPLSQPGDGASQKWKPQRVEQFCERQYVLLAPKFIFSTGKHHKFDHKQRLPFLNQLDWRDGGGAHGKVSKVQIHPDHHSKGEAHLASADETSFYAVKKFTDGTHFKNEREALLRFSSPRKGHEHIIQLLVSYEVGNEYFMIFPWANGNLAEFWKETRRNTQSGQDSYWLIKQCRGIAQALCKIHKHDSWNGDGHRDRGRHGDIKPENILRFEGAEPGHGFLTLADFTLMRFHSLESVDKTAPKEVGFSFTYCPPEVEGGQEARANQKHDVWSLGCVYLEFITWYLLGYRAIRGKYFKTPNGDEVQTFTTLRINDDGRHHGVPDDRFFKWTNESVVKVKVSVKNWIKMLHKNEHCSKAMHKFLKLVEDCMLVAQHKDRSLMHMVLRALNDIYSKSNGNRDYHCLGDPSPGLVADRFPPLFIEQNQVSKNVAETASTITSSSMDDKSNPDLRLIENLFDRPKVSNEGGESLSNLGRESVGDDMLPIPSNAGDLQVCVKRVKAEYNILPPGNGWTPKGKILVTRRSGIRRVISSLKSSMKKMRKKMRNKALKRDR